MNYVCHRRCFFNRVYEVGETVSDDRIYNALKPNFTPQSKASVETPKDDVVEPTTFTEVATKEKPKLPEIPDVLGKAKTTARKTSATKK